MATVATDGSYEAKPDTFVTQLPQSKKCAVDAVVEAMLAYRDQQNRTIDSLTIREMIEEGRKF